MMYVQKIVYTEKHWKPHTEAALWYAPSVLLARPPLCFFRSALSRASVVFYYEHVTSMSRS